jgi:hypothetical protein
MYRKLWRIRESLAILPLVDTPLTHFYFAPLMSELTAPFTQRMITRKRLRSYRRCKLILSRCFCTDRP